MKPAEARFFGGWALQLFGQELRKNFSYRADFFLNFFGTIGAQLVVAYFLWGAVFAARGASTLGGFGFSALMLYYVMVPLVDRMVRGEEMNFLSYEIYDGTLTRYLIYPVSLFAYKYVAHLAHGFLFTLQFLLALGVFFALFGMPPTREVTLASLAAGALATLAAGLLYFFMAIGLEMIAFWADNVWSILLILRFSIHFLGGGLIPLSFFPDWYRDVAVYLPFTYLIGFPVRCFLGEVGPGELAAGLGVICAWMLVFYTLAKLIWKRGILRYTGVGM